MPKLRDKCITESTTRQLTLSLVMEWAKGFERAAADKATMMGRQGAERNSDFHRFNDRPQNENNQHMRNSRNGGGKRDNQNTDYNSNDRNHQANGATGHSGKKFSNTPSPRTSYSGINSASDKCVYCNYKLHQDMSQCPAKGKVCDWCLGKKSFRECMYQQEKRKAAENW